MPPEDHFVSETTFHVRYAETDAMGVVNHVNYIVYFEEGRSDYARQRQNSYSSIEANGFYLMVTEVNARYLKPALYDRQITVLTWITESKSRTLMFSYEIIDTTSGDLLVTGNSKHICVTKEGKVTRIPDTWRSWGTGTS